MPLSVSPSLPPWPLPPRVLHFLTAFLRQPLTSLPVCVPTLFQVRPLPHCQRRLLKMKFSPCRSVPDGNHAPSSSTRQGPHLHHGVETFWSQSFLSFRPHLCALRHVPSAPGGLWCGAPCMDPCILLLLSRCIASIWNAHPGSPEIQPLPLHLCLQESAHGFFQAHLFCESSSVWCHGDPCPPHASSLLLTRPPPQGTHSSLYPQHLALCLHMVEPQQTFAE